MLSEVVAKHFRKGDYYRLTVGLTDASGTAYTMAATETLTLTIRELPDASSPVLLTVTSNAGSNVLEFVANIAVGMYSGDIQLNREGGHNKTVWPTDDELPAHGKIKNFKNIIIDAEVTSA